MTKFPGKLMQTYEETSICADGIQTNILHVTLVYNSLKKFGEKFFRAYQDNATRQKINPHYHRKYFPLKFIISPIQNTSDKVECISDIASSILPYKIYWNGKSR